MGPVQLKLYKAEGVENTGLDIVKCRMNFVNEFTRVRQPSSQPTS